MINMHSACTQELFEGPFVSADWVYSCCHHPPCFWTFYTLFKSSLTNCSLPPMVNCMINPVSIIWYIWWLWLQLCLAMAALAVQLSAEEWGQGGVVHWLGCELGSQPEAIPVLLELLAVFPQVNWQLFVIPVSGLKTTWSLSWTRRIQVGLSS